MLKQRTEKPHLKIALGDEKRCNLEDDDSFEEHKGAQHLTPSNAPRKSSINMTPKSRIIEPGKIFNSRQMTPSAMSGMRGRGGPMMSTAFFPRKSAGGTTNSKINHNYSRSNLLMGSNT